MKQLFVSLIAPEDIAPPSSYKRSAKVRQQLGTLSHIVLGSLGKLNTLQVALQVGLLQWNKIIGVDAACYERPVDAGLGFAARNKRTMESARSDILLNQRCVCRGGPKLHRIVVKLAIIPKTRDYWCGLHRTPNY